MTIDDLKCCGNCGNNHCEPIDWRERKENCELLVDIKASNRYCFHWKYDELANKERKKI